MINYNLQFGIYITIVMIAFVAGLCKYRFLDMGGKIFICLLGIVILGECADYYFAYVYRNNMPVYHVFTVVHLIVITIYFGVLNAIRLRYMLWFQLVIIVLAIFNCLYLQPLNTLNSNYLIFEGFCIILFSMFSLYKMMTDNDLLHIFKYLHFWIVTLMFILYCATFFYWGLFLILYKSGWQGWPVVSVLHWVINLLVYAGIGTSFIVLCKPNPQ